MSDDWLPGVSTASKPARIIFLLLIIGMPLWIGATGQLSRLVLFTGCLVLLLLVLRQKNSFYQPPGLFPLLLFCLWLLLQCIPLPPFLLKLMMPGYLLQLEQGFWLVSPDYWHPISIYPAVTLNEFFRFAAYLAFYLAATNLLLSTQGQKRLLFWLSGFFGLYSFFGLIQFFAPSDQVFWLFVDWPEAGRFFATYVNGNHYAALIGMVFPLLVVCLILNVPHVGYGSLRERLSDIFTDTELNRVILLGLVPIITAVSVFFSLSRSGTICLFASSLIMLILLVGREQLRGRTLVFLSVLVAAVGLLAFFGWDPLLERFFKTFNADGELQTQRLSYWLDSMNLFRAAPLTGSGAGTFVDAYPAWQTAITNGKIVDHAHNDYVEMLTDLGLIGIALVLWFWIDFLRAVIPAWLQRRNKAARLICVGSFAGLCAIMLHSFTDFNLAIPANGLYLFLLFALLASASHSSSDRRQGSSNRSSRQTARQHGTTTDRRHHRSHLPIFLSASKSRIFACGVFVLLFGFTVTGGTETARFKFAAAAELDLVNANTAQLEIIRTRAESAAYFAPLQPSYPFAAGMVQGKMANLDASLEKYRQAIARRPLHVEYQLQTARTLFAMQQPEQSAILLKNAVLLDPFNWSTRRELASFYLASNQLTRALEVFRAGLKINPLKAGEVLRVLIVAGIDRDDFFKAMPQRSRSWAVLGDFLLQLDDLDKAGRAYRRGFDALQVEKVADGYIVWRYLALLQKQQRNAEALELLRNALELFPQNQYFLARQGLLYEREGLRDRAIESFRASILIDPRHDWVRKRLRKLEKDRS